MSRVTDIHNELDRKRTFAHSRPVWNVASKDGAGFTTIKNQNGRRQCVLADSSSATSFGNRTARDTKFHLGEPRTTLERKMVWSGTSTGTHRRGRIVLACPQHGVLQSAAPEHLRLATARETLLHKNQFVFAPSLPPSLLSRLSLFLFLSFFLLLSDVNMRSPVAGSREECVAGQQPGPASPTQDARLQQQSN